MAAGVLLVVEIIMKIISLVGIGGALINALMLVFIINGVRGALTLRRGAFEEDLSDVFN